MSRVRIGGAGGRRKC